MVLKINLFMFQTLIKWLNSNFPLENMPLKRCSFCWDIFWQEDWWEAFDNESSFPRLYSISALQKNALNNSAPHKTALNESAPNENAPIYILHFFKYLLIEFENEIEPFTM